MITVNARLNVVQQSLLDALHDWFADEYSPQGDSILWARPQGADLRLGVEPLRGPWGDQTLHECADALIENLPGLCAGWRVAEALQRVRYRAADGEPQVQYEFLLQRVIAARP